MRAVSSIVVSVLAAACVTNPPPAGGPDWRSAYRQPAAPGVEVAPQRRAPTEVAFVHPRSWRGLRIGEPSACTAYDGSDYASSGPWPAPRLWAVPRGDGFRSVLSCTAFDSVRSVALGRVVPPAAAHAAGLCAAPPLVRRAFASDPDNWVYAERAVFADGRRGRGPDGWLPTRNACWYARAQLRIRQRYGLTVTEAEARALEALLDRCGEAGRRPACGQPGGVWEPRLGKVVAAGARDYTRGWNR